MTTCYELAMAMGVSHNELDKCKAPCLHSFASSSPMPRKAELCRLFLKKFARSFP